METSHHLKINSEIIRPHHSSCRYFFLPGSVARAAVIAQMFDQIEHHIETPRRNDTFTGVIKDSHGRLIDVGVTATGMGVGSAEIIMTELIEAGARRFLRVGTSGAIIDEPIKAGDFVIATAAIRDEMASQHYLPLEYPAIADSDMVYACKLACLEMGVAENSFAGIIHSKASLFARAKMAGPLAESHRQYKKMLQEVLVLSSEMEASLMFILSDCHTKKVEPISVKNQSNKIKTGALLGIIGTEKGWANSEAVNQIEKNTCSLAIEAIRQLHRLESTL